MYWQYRGNNHRNACVCKWSQLKRFWTTESNHFIFLNEKQTPYTTTTDYQRKHMNLCQWWTIPVRLRAFIDIEKIMYFFFCARLNWQPSHLQHLKSVWRLFAKLWHTQGSNCINSCFGVALMISDLLWQGSPLFSKKWDSSADCSTIFGLPSKFVLQYYIHL